MQQKQDIFSIPLWCGGIPGKWCSYLGELRHRLLRPAACERSVSQEQDVDGTLCRTKPPHKDS